MATVVQIPRLIDPVFLMSLYNERIREGQVKLHPWQTEVLLRYALPSDKFDYKNNVNRINLVANNGSGKSAMVVAPAAVWLAMRFPDASVVITSSSGKQLDQQTGRAVKHMCEQVNRLHGARFWDTKYREYTFKPNPNAESESKIFMYATDDAGKAEGYHPLVPDGMFACIVDEAKTVPEDIFKAVERCNGKSHWMNVSSPGQPLGFFYNAVCSSRWWNRKVTAYDCPHIKREEIESAKESFGESSPFFRSAYLAEFTSVNESVVIPYDKILAQYRQPADWFNDGIRRAGVDLSAGGDEQVVVIMDGNKIIAMECFNFTDHRIIKSKLVEIFRKYGLVGENISIDDGYTGRAVIDFLRDDGYQVVPVQFGGKAYNNVAYGNRGTELWMNYERHISNLILFDDALLRKQLASRYYKRSDTTGKIILESKREARANGHGSPDRADAAVLAISRLPLGYFNGALKPAEPASEEDQARDIIRRIAKDGHTALTEDEITKITLTYQRIRSEHRRHKEVQERANAAATASRYDCQAFTSESKFGGDSASEYTFKRFGSEEEDN